MTRTLRNRLLKIVPLALIAVPGCTFSLAGLLPFQVTKGSGVILEETRSVSPFHEIESHNAFHVRYQPAPETSLVIKGDDNLVALVQASVNPEGRLVIKLPDNTNIQSKHPLQVSVSSPGISYLEATGACQVDATLNAQPELEVELSGASQAKLVGIESDTLKVALSGASRAQVAGKAATASFRASGASSISAAECPVDGAKVDLSGASRATLVVQTFVTGEASGASTVTLVGKPAEIDVDTSGASKVAYESAGSTADELPPAIR